MKQLKPYCRRGGKYFYRKGKKKMTVDVPDKGSYVFNGDVIEATILLPLYNGQKLNAEIWAYKNPNSI